MTASDTIYKAIGERIQSLDIGAESKEMAIRLVKGDPRVKQDLKDVEYKPPEVYLPILLVDVMGGIGPFLEQQGMSQADIRNFGRDIYVSLGGSVTPKYE